MEVAIIGSGKMAHGIGTRILDGRHSLTVYDRDFAKSQDLARQLDGGSAAALLGTQIVGSVVILALPYPAILEFIDKYSEQLAGKILVDISNPVDFQTFKLIPPADSSGAQEIAKKLPVETKLVKAFNTTFSATLSTGKVADQSLDVFVASDDGDAKKIISQLVSDGGMRPLDAGPLSSARYLEGFQLLLMTMQNQFSTPWSTALKILP